MKKVLSFAMALAMSLSLVACGDGGDKPSTTNGSTSNAGGNGGSAASTTLKIGHVESEDRSTHRALLIFKDELEELTEGRIKVEIFANAEMGGDEELCESVAMGTLQMALPSTSVLTAYNDKIGVLDMPYLFKDSESAFAALDGDLGARVNEFIAGNGFINLGYTYNGPRSTINGLRPIHTAADLKGMKMRVMTSPVFIDMYETLGSNVTPMSFSEVFTGLQQNLVDGMESPASLIYSSGFHEVQKYFTVDNHVHNFLALLTNENWYNSLSADDQKALQACCDRLVDTQRKLELEDNDIYIQKLADANIEVTFLSDEEYQTFVDAVQPMYDKYKGMWGNELFDIAESYN